MLPVHKTREKRKDSNLHKTRRAKHPRCPNTHAQTHPQPHRLVPTLWITGMHGCESLIIGRLRQVKLLAEPVTQHKPRHSIPIY